MTCKHVLDQNVMFLRSEGDGFIRSHQKWFLTKRGRLAFNLYSNFVHYARRCNKHFHAFLLWAEIVMRVMGRSLTPVLQIMKKGRKRSLWKRELNIDKFIQGSTKQPCYTAFTNHSSHIYVCTYIGSIFECYTPQGPPLKCKSLSIKANARLNFIKDSDIE